MGDGANVFNTFSFNKWADGKREEEIDKESRRRRAEQIKRLKERLRKERALREAQGDGDLDLDALIEAIQRGEIINMPDQTYTTEDISTSNIPPVEKSTNGGIPDQLSDDYIFREINQYANRVSDLRNSAEIIDTTPIAPVLAKPDPMFWKYNRRNQNDEMIALPEQKAEQKNQFKYNRMMN